MRALTATLGVLFLVFALYVQSTISGSVDNLRSAVHELKKENVRMQLSSSWKDASNITHTVTTNRGDGESDDVFYNRHKSGVDALKALFPPV
jgi:hypothetical protein